MRTNTLLQAAARPLITQKRSKASRVLPARVTPTLNQLSALSTDQLLLTGGDARLAIDLETHVNKYGCGSHPDPSLVAFGSSTGSTISLRGYNASHFLHQYLIRQQGRISEGELYRHELDRVRAEFQQLCGFTPQDNIATIFAASGTDLHLICSQLLAESHDKPLRIIMMDACETGSGVAPAVRGQHFSDHAALGGTVTAFNRIEDAYPIEVSSIALRHVDGSKRPLAAIDAEVEVHITNAIANQQRVLLIMIDVSKTGLIAPSPSYVAQLRQRYAEQVDVLVDACQFRVSTKTLAAYLDLGCMLTLTGSKFLTGPAFSGMLFIPPNLSARLSQHPLPAALADYSAQAEWPEHWDGSQQLNDCANWGLLLRLEAALTEFKAFRAIPELHVSGFLQQFSSAVQDAIQASPHFSLMAERLIDRSPIVPRARASWDQITTIFPFILMHKKARPLSREQTQLIYQKLQTTITDPTILPTYLAELRGQLGQPVLCGTQHGVEVSALRMCASSRVIIEACEHGTESAREVIEKALNVLNKTAYLIKASN